MKPFPVFQLGLSALPIALGHSPPPPPPSKRKCAKCSLFLRKKAKWKKKNKRPGRNGERRRGGISKTNCWRLDVKKNEKGISGKKKKKKDFLKAASVFVV